jgi:glycosyltransferase involved in cell wall biosynthesis
MKLSIIIPVFNSAIFLEACLNSILNQNMNTANFEIIIVNDGSSDNSEKIIKSWHVKNPEIGVKYFFQENKGQGSARNFGIRQSSGIYLWFIDSDDFLDPECAKILLKELEKYDLDAIWFNHRLIDLNGKILPQPKVDKKTNYTQEIFSGENFLKYVFNTSCMPVMFMFKKEILIQNSLNFHEGIYFEDNIFTPKLIFYAKKIKYCNLVVYNYVIHESSTMRSSDNLKKRTLDSIIVSKELKFFSNQNTSKILKSFIDKFSSQILMYNYRLAIGQKNSAFLKEFKLELIKYDLYPFSINKPLTIALISKIANLSPYIFKKLCTLRPIK